MLVIEGKISEWVTIQRRKTEKSSIKTLDFYGNKRLKNTERCK
jgi:hypothetical protein